MAMRNAEGTGPRGQVFLVNGKSDDPVLSDGASVGGGSSVHYWDDSAEGLRTNSICLPVPAHSHYHTDVIDTSSTPQTRIGFAETRLTFGEWQPCFSAGSGRMVMTSDGFLFVSLHAGNGERRVVECFVDRMNLASAAVHFDPDQDAWIQDACCCMPVPRGSEVVLNTYSWGSPQVKVWWLPSISLAWRFEAPVPRSLNTRLTAETDGILNAVLIAGGEGARSTLQLYSGPDASGSPEAAPFASATMVHKTDKNRYISRGAAMLPVQNGLAYRAAQSGTEGPVSAHAFWTAIVPVV